MSSNIEFESSHLKYQTYIQRHFTKPRSLAEVKLLGPLFDNDGRGNIISANDVETAESYNNIVVILPTFFFPCNRLQSLFTDMSTIDNNYS